MKKLIIFTLVSVVLTSVCMAGMLDTVVLTQNNIPTGTVPTKVVGSMNGIIQSIQIVPTPVGDVDIDIDIYDWASNLLFTADDVITNAYYIPLWPATLTAGGIAPVYDLTNIVPQYVQPPNGGEISVLYSDPASATSSCSVTILYKKR